MFLVTVPCDGLQTVVSTDTSRCGMIIPVQKEDERTD